MRIQFSPTLRDNSDFTNGETGVMSKVTQLVSGKTKSHWGLTPISTNHTADSPKDILCHLTPIRKTTSVGEDVEKLEPLCTVGRNIKWCSHCGKQYGGSLRKKKNDHMIQQFHFWVYTQKN